MSRSCPKVARRLPESCLEVVRKLPERCPEAVRELSESCPRAAKKLPERRPKVAQKLARDISTDMVTKIVPTRVVNMPIGAFCTKFLRERFCDDDFLSLPQPIGRPEAGNLVCHSRSADRLHQPMELIGNSSRLVDWSQPIGVD